MADKQLTRFYGDLLVANKQIGDRLEDLQLFNPEELGHYVRSRLGRKEEAKKLASLGISWRQIAKLLGVSHVTIQRDLAQDVPENGTKCATGAAKAAATRTAHEEIAKFAFDQRAEAIIGDPIRLGDFYERSFEIKTDSVDLIFTDPPYDDESISSFERMGEVAARILKPGGSLVTYCGHRQIFAAGEMLSKHLRFWQPLCCLHTGSGQLARLTEYGVIVRFKPMLWFVKGTRSDKQTFVENVVASGGAEKDWHEWQQTESDAAYFIDALSPIGGLVVDFFAGGGTTIVAAKRLGRIGLGFEIDLKHFRSAMKRIGGDHDVEQAA